MHDPWPIQLTEAAAEPHTFAQHSSEGFGAGSVSFLGFALLARVCIADDGRWLKWVAMYAPLVWIARARAL